MAEVTLFVFARAPVPGQVKTRLAAHVGAERAAALYRAFLADTVRVCVAAGGFEVVLSCAGDPDHPALVEIAATFGVERMAQPGGDLGSRMTATLDLRPGSLIVGSDAPTLPADCLRRARAALAEHDVVVGPSADGGYYLLGGVAGLDLGGVRWSSRHALADTLARVAPRRAARLPPWYDVDEPADLRLLRAHLALEPGAAPATSSLRF